MFRPLLGLSESDLERQLLRKGVGRLAASRHACSDCGRTPLVGEHVHRYGTQTVCTLCRPRHRGVPESVDTVHHSERGQAVRLRARAA
ncbi:hypothetical protein [Paraconexibacter sp.]|uniref:hypothetical protein n=1 Tax=Paraconexibacter sp. TaxID=2949640 RepID=UPI003561EB39